MYPALPNNSEIALDTKRTLYIVSMNCVKASFNPGLRDGNELPRREKVHGLAVY
jgi:hypothetical protein